MSSAQPLALDHIIVLIPAKDLDTLSKHFTDAFAITPGGTHADGKTYNKLIILESGVYLELIAFVDDDPAKKEGHWWGKKAPGSIIDWALTSNDVKDAERLRDVGYDAPRRGGRKRDDGKSVEWFVTFPSPETERGSVPFFCHDITPRNLRVPGEGIHHSSGAVSVGNIVIVAAPEKTAGLIDAYTSILGAPTHKDGKSWQLTETSPIRDTTAKGPVLELREAVNEEDWQVVRDNGGVAGVKEISLLCRKQHGGEKEDSKVEVSFGDGRKITINLLAT